MYMWQKALFSLIFIAFFAVPFSARGADSPLLTKEENYWLSSRNDTIVVYSGKNYPPFSYQSASGIIQGLCVDYLELIAKNLGIKVHYATPRSQAQIIADMKSGRGDVAISISESKETSEYFVFSESFVHVPIVIVVRKDTNEYKNATMNDFVGKRVAVVEGSLAESFIRENYPRVVLETVTDNEVGLQQTVLAETDAVVMDVASLSFLLSKQVVSSVKIVGNLGIDYQPTFAVPKDKEILQSILEKGMTQIATDERQMLSEKWVTLPGESKQPSSFFTFFKKDTILFILYVVSLLAIIVVIVTFSQSMKKLFLSKKTSDSGRDLTEEMKKLESVSDLLAEELKEVQQKEKEIAKKLNEIND